MPHPRAARTALVTSAAILFSCTPAVHAAPADASAGGPIYRVATGVGADARSVNFSWRSDHAGTEVVRVAPVNDPVAVREVTAREADFGAIAYRSRHAELAGLDPGVTYSYQIGSDAGGWSTPETFTIDDGDGNWTFLAVADAQIGVDVKISEQAATWRETLDSATAAHPDSSLILSLGDQVEGWGDLIGPLGQYNAFFSAPQLRQFRTAALEGNHEVLPLPVARRHFKEHWNLPNELGDTSHYFFEQNNALFIALNSNRKDDAGLHEQAAFVRDTVAAHGEGKDWIIVANHFAFHSQGGRYTSDDIVRMREVLGPVFSEVGVDVVLNGHDHMHNRSHLINGAEPKVPEHYAAPGDVLHPEEGDVLYLTLNTAVGGKYYDYQGNDGKTYPDMTLEQSRARGLNHPTIALWNQDRTPDYSVVNITPTTLQVRSLNAADGTLVDDVTLLRQDTPAPSGPGSSGSSSSTGSSVGAIAGIAVAVAALGALAGLALNLLRF